MKLKEYAINLHEKAELDLAHAFDQLAQRMLDEPDGDMELMLADYPEHVDQLRAMLPALQMLTGAGTSHLDEIPKLDGTSQSEPALRTLGDYRLLGEIGRGGMGVVYEATQISLGRSVALKVLPFAAMLDQRQLARFHNEARAAATLNHPHIVPVYAVGEQRGVHYYAMQFIRGQSLAQIISHMRSTAHKLSVSLTEGANTQPWISKHKGPAGHISECRAAKVAENTRQAIRHVQVDFAQGSDETRPDTQAGPQAQITTEREIGGSTYFRSVARLGIQIAQALDHAHAHGILHRDVKPANILVDSEGTAWITDFGLARLEGDAGMTMTGDLLGTVRYMSPEQSLAKRVVVDHRSDIYSLGVTLYEMLTLRPAFTGRDRQELLRQITFDDPRSPRSLDRSIPVDLETIVMTAAAKRPEDRYSSAEALADDLQRFVAHQPIHAKPPNLVDRTLKWSRRHRSLVLAATTFVAILFLVVLTATGLLAKAWQEATAAGAEYRAQFLAARANLYRAHMSIANEDWEQGRLDAADRMLDEFQPKPGQPDLRKWEWYYLQSICHRDVKAVPGWIVKASSSNQLPWVYTREGDVLFLREYASSDLKLQFASPDRGRLEDLLVLSPDGKQLLYANNSWEKHDSVLQLWDLVTRRKVTERASIPLICDAAWSPDGKKFMTAQYPEEVKIWDALECNPVAALSGLEGFGIVRSVAWSADGTRIAAGANAWSPDGTRIDAGAKTFGWVGIWNVDKGVRVHRMDGHWALVTALEFSPDGKRLASVSADQHLKIWDASSGENKLDLLAHYGHVNDVKWSPDGTNLATVGSDGLVKVWNATTGVLLKTLRGHRSPAGQVQWIDEGQLASSAEDGTKQWDVNGEQRSFSIPAGSKHSWSPSGRHLFFVQTKPQLLTIDKLNVETGMPDGQAIHDVNWNAENVESLAIDPTGGRLAVSSSVGTLNVWDLQNGALQLTMDACPGHEMRDVDWSPDGSMLATSTLGGPYKIWDSETGEEIASLDSGRKKAGASVAWSPDGSKLATLSFTQDTRIWDTANWTEVHHLGAERSGAWSSPGWHGLCWSPIGDRLAVRYGGGWIVVWDVRSGRQVLAIPAHTSNARAIAWSPDGSRLASGSEDHTVKIWSAETGEDLLTLRDHGSEVYSLSWSPDGRKLAAGGGDTLTIWDASTGYERYR